MTAPLASTDFTVPEISLPFSWLATKLLKGSPSSCLIPSEIRSRSTSIESTWASVSSPFLKLRTASSPGSVHDRSERCTRPSIPPCKPMKMPKSVIDLIWPLTLSPFLKFIENSCQGLGRHCFIPREIDRKSTRLNSSHVKISYAVVCLKKKKKGVWTRRGVGGNRDKYGDLCGIFCR